MRSRLLWVFLPLCIGALLFACVGDDNPAPQGSASPDASNGTDGGSSGDPDSATNNTSDSGADADPGPPGGDTLAQLSFVSQALYGQILPAKSGGLYVMMRYSHSSPPTIGGTTIACTTCDIVLKLNAGLSTVEWYAYNPDPSIGRSQIATSPAGDLYWSSEVPGDGNYTVTFKGSQFASDVVFNTVGNSNQGEDTGGGRFVIALSATGSVRWSHMLAQTNTVSGNYVGSFSTFAASDNAVLSTFDDAKGSISYNDSVGLKSVTIGANAALIHELNPSTGKTVQLLQRARSTTGDVYIRGVGVQGFNNKGFAVWRQTRDSSNAITGHTISLGELGNGAYTPFVNYPSVVPVGKVNDLRPARYKSYLLAYGQVETSLTLGSQTYNAAASGIDSLFFVLDNATATVKASASFGGSGYDVGLAMIDVGNDDVYCVGTYRSSDLTIAGTKFPPPPDALSDGVYAIRARVDEANKTIVPRWGVGFMGDKRTGFYSATADAITGDLYIFGWLGSGGTFNFGGTPITVPPTTNTNYLIKIRRGGL